MRRCRAAAEARKTLESQLEYADNTSKREEHEQQGPVATRPLSQYAAQGARSRLDLPGERHQAAGPDRIVRPVRGAAAQLGGADGLQARHLHGRAVPADLPRRRQGTRIASADPQAAVVVCLDFGDDAYEESVAALVRLVESAGIRRHALVRGKRSRPDPKFYAGSGKVAEIGLAVDELNAAFVVFNHELSPAQQRNVEKEVERRVLDLTEVILEIFA